MNVKELLLCTLILLLFGIPSLVGQDISTSDIEAAKLAAWHNDVEAQYNRGLCYHYGFGVDRNLYEAKK